MRATTMGAAGLMALAVAGCSSYESEQFWSHGTDAVRKPGPAILESVSFRASIWFTRKGSSLEAQVPIRITNRLGEALQVDSKSVWLEDDEGKKFDLAGNGTLKVVPGVSEPVLWVFSMGNTDLSKVAYLNLRWSVQGKFTQAPVELITRFDRLIPPSAPPPLPPPPPPPLGMPEPPGPDLGAP